jgi:thioredoxin-related protein
MKKLLLILCVVPAFLFSGNLKFYLRKAKIEKKPLMVIVTAKHCKYCSKMKRETLEDNEVKKNMKGFLFTKVDKNSIDAKKYLPKIRYTPTVYFISPKYHIVNTVKGYLGASDFNMWIDDSRKKLGMKVISHPTQTYENRYVQPEKNSIWMYDLDSAMDFASQTGKQIMVFVGSNKSKWSKKMEKTTLKNKKVKSKLNNFVWVKLNYGNIKAKEYGINPKYVPTVYFLKEDLSQLAVAKGYYKTNDFIKWIKYAKSKL